jgi:PKHD-type hydroxylase
MYLRIPGLLPATQVATFQDELQRANWIDGRATAGHLSVRAKQNAQLAERDPLALELGAAILDRLETHPTFMSAALPRRIVPPLFNRYEGGEQYGRHIDGAVRPLPGSTALLRTDLSATLFLSDPDSYDGGEIVTEEPTGDNRSFKLAAGDLLLYPGTTVHRIEPVRAGVRLAAFFWIQSMIRSRVHREMLHGLDTTILRLSARHPDDPCIVDLTAHYHNLVREWAEV